MTHRHNEHEVTASQVGPIVAEVRAQREAIVAATAGDSRRIYADLKVLEQQEREAGRAILRHRKKSG
jgi:hypothetical protein